MDSGKAGDVFLKSLTAFFDLQLRVSLGLGIESSLMHLYDTKSRIIAAPSIM